jgi:hypothetical protein
MTRKRARTRGITLFEAGLATSLLACTAGATALWFGPRADAHDAEQALERAAALDSAVETWQADHEGCPTISVLKRDSALPKDAVAEDPWGTRYRIVCEEGTHAVLSAGRDGMFATSDDVRVPRD